jgi:chitin disaccharide deacetylase
VQLILNADDLGYSPGVNEAILTLYRAGRLTSASLIVNLPHSPAAISLARTAGLPAGVHLNLTRGRPCLRPETVPSLVNADGAFYASPAFFARALSGLVRPAEVEAECRAQIDHALAGLGRVTHLDSHSHWHLVPALRPVLEQLARDYAVGSVRTADPRRTLYPNVLWLVTLAAGPAAPDRPARSDYLLSLHHWLDEDATPIPLLSGRRVCRLLAQSSVIVELVTHPGRSADPDFPRDTLPAGRRQRECDFLLGPAFPRWLATVGAKVSQPVRLSPT